MRVWPSRSGIAVLVAIGLLASSAVVAQYVKYPTANVPRTADGKPNLKAPTPRTADGKPDFSGMWFTDDAVPCARSGGAAFFECGIELPLSQYGVNYGYAIPGGLPYQPWAAELVKKRMAENAKDDPHVRCMPDTFLRSYGLPHYQKWIQVPGLLVQLDEMNAMYRQIFTDGRPLPTDPNPAWNGYRRRSGTRTRSSSTRAAFATTSGSTSAAASSAKRQRSVSASGGPTTGTCRSR